jgi:hypothetical protein
MNYKRCFRRRESLRKQRSNDLRFWRGLRNRRVSDVANLAGAMIFVVRDTVRVANGFRAK